MNIHLAPIYNQSDFLMLDKLQKEVNDSRMLCRDSSEWSMCKVFIEKDLFKLGYELSIYDKVIKRSN